MSTIIMTQRTAEASPRLKARVAGALYLTGVGSLFTVAVLGSLVVSGDAAATANNILSHQLLYRLALVADIIQLPCYIAVTALYYYLFKPVNRSVALIAVFLGLVGSTMGAVNDFFALAPLVILGGAHSATALAAGQAQGLALAGVCYLVNSFANFLAPSFAAHLSPYILIPGAVEIVLALWLLVMGVNAERWNEQARAAGERL